MFFLVIQIIIISLAQGGPTTFIWRRGAYSPHFQANQEQCHLLAGCFRGDSQNNPNLAPQYDDIENDNW